MAGGAVVSSVLEKVYQWKMTLCPLLPCIIATTGGLIFGYSIGVSGGVTTMDPFLRKFYPSVYHNTKEHENDRNYCMFDSPKLTMFTSSLYLAALVASLFGSWMASKFGSKISMIMGGLIFLVGATINGAAMSVAMLIIGRILLGVGVGFEIQAVLLYLCEMAPANYRCFFNLLFQLMITIGILAANVVNYSTYKIKGGWGWRVSLAGAAVPAAIITVGGALFLVDAPNSLNKCHPDDLERAKSCNDPVAAGNEWNNILMKKYRPQLVMAILIPIFQQLTGINIIMFYAPVLFKTIGLGDNASLGYVVFIGFVIAVFIFCSIFLVDGCPRQVLYYVCGAVMLIGQVTLAIKLGQNGVATISSSGADHLFVFISVYVNGFAWSWGPLGWLVPSEMFPLEIRPAGQSINVSVNMLFTFLIAQAFPSMLCLMKFRLFYCFTFWLVCMTMFAILFIPETINVPIEEVWKRHWFWSKFISDDDIPEGLELHSSGGGATQAIV